MQVVRGVVVHDVARRIVGGRQSRAAVPRIHAIAVRTVVATRVVAAAAIPIGVRMAIIATIIPIAVLVTAVVPMATIVIVTM